MLRSLTAPLIIAAISFGCGNPETQSRSTQRSLKGNLPELEVGGPRPPGQAGPQVAPPPRLLPHRTAEQSLAAGVSYLLREQSTDGAWRSDRYATFKDGLALTPLVVCALQEAARAGVESPATITARRKGLEFLARLVKADGSIEAGPDGIDYPVYTAALIIQALAHHDGTSFTSQRNAWVQYLKARQLREKLGWKPNDKQYGGWGYCHIIPSRPEPNAFAAPLLESNLSATVFALEALAAVNQLDPDNKRAAATFVRRCQNRVEDGDEASIKISSKLDGGFHFIYDDPLRNKAGVDPEAEEDGRQRFYSYGSATADGLRALAICDLPEDVKRIRAAEGWLSRNFQADSHPGRYRPAHESNREAVYYYYAASVAKTMGDQRIALADGSDWKVALASAISRRQRGEGCWTNLVELVREDEPLTATSHAIIALARCIKSQH